MAIVRCQDHPPRTFNYEIAVEPMGFPETALICGREGEDHDAVGWVYLLPDEYEASQDGRRVFPLWGPESSSDAAKVRVSDDVVEGVRKWTDEDEDTADGTRLQSESTLDRYQSE